MKFPLDNRSRRTAGCFTGAIHDATGKIVLSVARVNLPIQPGEDIRSWRSRETAATVARAGAVVRTLNACYSLVRSMEAHSEQLWLPGIDRSMFPDGEVTDGQTEKETD